RNWDRVDYWLFIFKSVNLMKSSNCHLETVPFKEWNEWSGDVLPPSPEAELRPRMKEVLNLWAVVHDSPR
ncbi:hypothetical protein GBF38_007460, partial [Nibea albiflora]